MFFNDLVKSVLTKGLNLDPDFWKPTQYGKVYDAQKIVANTTERPYEYHTWLYSCVAIVSDTLSIIPRVIYDTRTDTVIDDHPVLDLIQRSNPQCYGTQFLKEIVVNLLLDGQTFILPNSKQILGAGQIPEQLYVTQTRFMESYNDSMNNIAGWNYKPDSSDIQHTNAQLIRIYFYNPYDKKIGLAPLSVARAAVGQDANALAYVNNFFRNQASLGGVLKTPNIMTEDQAKGVAEQFRHAFSGPDKAGKTAVLHSGLEFQSVTSSFAAMQYDKQMALTKDMLLAIFRVPKSLLSDYSEVNYSNSITARKAFYNECIKPLDTVINQAITYQWVADINPYWELRSDYSGVEALNEIAKEKVDAYKVLIDSGLPREEAARVLDIPVDWEYVDELEAKKEQETEQAVEPPAEEPEEESEEEEVTEESAKLARRILSANITIMRSNVMNQLKKQQALSINVEHEMSEMLVKCRSVYQQLVESTLEKALTQGKQITVTAEEIGAVVQAHMNQIKEHLIQVREALKDCTTTEEIHNLFQPLYGLSKEISLSKAKALYRLIMRNA